MRKVNAEQSAKATNGYSTVGESMTVAALPLAAAQHAVDTGVFTTKFPALPDGALVAGAPIFQIWPADSSADPIVYRPEQIGDTIALMNSRGNLRLGDIDLTDLAGDDSATADAEEDSDGDDIVSEDER